MGFWPRACVAWSHEKGESVSDSNHPYFEWYSTVVKFFQRKSLFGISIVLFTRYPGSNDFVVFLDKVIFENYIFSKYIYTKNTLI